MNRSVTTITSTTELVRNSPLTRQQPNTLRIVQLHKLIALAFLGAHCATKSLRMFARLSVIITLQQANDTVQHRPPDVVTLDRN